MRISLDVQAIKHLIDNDPDCIVEIKKGVVDNLIKKGIVPLLSLPEIKKEIFEVKRASTEALEFWNEILREEIAKQVGTVVTKKQGWDTLKEVTLKPEIKQKIGEQARRIFSDEMENTLKVQSKKSLDDMLSHIKAIIDRRFIKNINALVDDEVDRRLEKAKKA